MDDSMAESDFAMDASSDFELPKKAPAVIIVSFLFRLPSPLTTITEEGSRKEGTCCSQTKGGSQEADHSQINNRNQEGSHKEIPDTDQ
jgi:hypothetical protein